MTADVIAYQSQNNNDLNTNGGRIIHNTVNFAAGGSGNFPPVSNAERLAGIERFRKWGLKVLGVTTAAKLTVMLQPTPSPDTRAFMIAGTQRDTKASIGTRKYGTGTLNTTVNASDTVLIVDFEDGQGADNVVQAGDYIAVVENSVEDKPLLVDSVVWTVDQAEITLNASTPITQSFTTAAIVGSLIINTTDVNPSVSDYIKAFTDTTFDEINYPILVDRIGTDEETITVEVIDSTTYSVTSDIHGALPNGQFSTDYTYTHPQLTELVFTIQAAAFGGTPTTGDTFSFQVHPAIVPVWVGYECLAGAVKTIDGTPFIVWLESI